MSAKLLDLYPTLMSGEYQYYESIPSADPDFAGAPNESHIVEVCESNGTQYVITSDGSQYMVIDATEGQQTVATTEGQSAQQSADMIVDDLTIDQSGPQVGPKDEPKHEPNDEPKDEPMEPTPDECRKCVSQVIDMLSDNKENIDPNTDSNAKPVRKKRSYRRRVKTEDTHLKTPSHQIDSTVSKVRKQTKLRNMAKND